MRQIEKGMIHALRNRQNWKRANTEVRISPTLSEVYLFGNRIFWVDHTTGDITFDNCDYHTATTRSRLSALASEFAWGETDFRIRDFYMQVYSGGEWYHMFSPETVNPFETAA